MSWAINDKDYSQRRACRLIGLAPKVYRYRTRRSDDGALRARLRSLAPNTVSFNGPIPPIGRMMAALRFDPRRID